MMETILRKAIQGKNRVGFRYENESHVMEPHMVAHNKNGHVLLNGWVIQEEVPSKKEGWRDYMLAGISSLKILPETFPKARFGYNPMDERKYSRVQFSL